MMHEELPPSDYNQLSLSGPHYLRSYQPLALLTTKLTGKSGHPVGNALELVQSIETINGKVPKARGDLQFRMYVVLKPDAAQKLKDSTEFFRDRDNTIYHHGYPVNFLAGMAGVHLDPDFDGERRAPCRHRRGLSLVKIPSSPGERPSFGSELRRACGQ